MRYLSKHTGRDEDDIKMEVRENYAKTVSNF
jgi:hypothetical protein